MSRWVLLAFVACAHDPKPTTEDTSGTEDTSAASNTGDTGPGTLEGRCVYEQDVSSGILASAWRSPTGTLFAVGASPQSRVRSPDGLWTLDPPSPAVAFGWRVHGSADDEVWALGYNSVLRRQSDGTWLDQGAPIPQWEAVSLHVFGPSDVLVLRVEDLTCTDCYTRQRPSLVWWDGASWSEDVLPIVEGPVLAGAVLPDRSVVLAADGGLVQVGGGTIPTPPSMYVRDVLAADDGTLVALGSGSDVAIGDTSGLLESSPPSDVDEWSHAWAASATDVWVAGERWELGVTPWAAVAHWDGVSWTEVLTDDPSGMLTLAGGGEVFAVGGYDHEVAMVGDAEGLAIERETWGVGALRSLAIDDVTGEVWASGYGPVLGRLTDGAWQGVPLPDRSIGPERVAVTGGRVLVVESERLHVLEGDALGTTEVEGWYWTPAAAAGGALFAASEPSGGDGPDLPAEVWRDAGSGWESLDTTGLPAGFQPIALWADGPEELWMAIELPAGGALAQWDGAAWSLPVTGLPESPSWVGRGADGVLYFTRFQGPAQGTQTLWTWDGATASPVPDLVPDIRSAHVLADGTLVVSVIAEAETTDEDLYGRLVQRPPGGDWEELLSAASVIPFVGSADTIWSSGAEGSAWQWAPCSR